MVCMASNRICVYQYGRSGLAFVYLSTTSTFALLSSINIDTMFSQAFTTPSKSWRIIECLKKPSSKTSIT